MEHHTRAPAALRQARRAARACTQPQRVWNWEFRPLVPQGGTCTLTTTMEDMVAKVVAGHHRRLWVVVRHTPRTVCCHPPFRQPNAEPPGQDDAGVPIGVISLTDLINAVADRMDAVKILD